MKKLVSSFIIGCVASSAAMQGLIAEDWTAGMQKGTITLRSAGPLTFGPEGILFIADSKSASVYAVNTQDLEASPSSEPLKIENIEGKIGALLGVPSDEILIQDLVTNPASKKVYIAVSRGRGPDAQSVLIRALPDSSLQVVSLKNVSYSQAVLPDAPPDQEVGEGRRRSNPRSESITDIAFFQDRVLIAGLSNEEFASSLRAIPFPFKTIENGATVEIYHGAHGRFETRSPVRTFVPFTIGDQPHLLAAYTCTPLVQFPLASLKPGSSVVGKTIAELGNRNRPIDMVVYQKKGQDYLLLANSSRGVMRMKADSIEDYNPIEKPVRDGNTEGLPYDTVETWKGIEQLDLWDAHHAVVLQKLDSGSSVLQALPLP